MKDFHFNENCQQRRNHLLRLFPMNNSGIILIVVLWFLIILTVMAVGLGRRTSIDLAMTKHSIGKLKAYYAAFGGLIYAVDFIKRDAEDQETRNFDTLYLMGLKLEEGDKKEELFQDIELGEGVFSIYFEENQNGETIRHYGFHDEESKINLNGIKKQNIGALVELIKLFDVEEERALAIAYSVIDWQDKDEQLSDEIYGAEGDYYSGSIPTYSCKNKPFDTVDELKLVRGVTEDLFENIKEYLTVYPKNATNLKVNYDSASETVLKALMRSMAGQRSNTEIADADSLVEKMLTYRRGDDGIQATEDDERIEIGQMQLNAKERTVFLTSQSYVTKKSRFLHLLVSGIDHSSGAESILEAVVDRENYAFVEFYRH